MMVKGTIAVFVSGVEQEACEPLFQERFARPSAANAKSYYSARS
jgi:hypothetical protein